MSGVEFIVGAVLASVPIALETYDRSGRLFEVFSMFKQYPREILILEAKLGAQRTIFRNNAINLLTAITKDRAKVQEVMSRPASPAARQDLVMAPVYRHRVDALDESFVACRQTAEQIQMALQVLCFQSDAFRVELGEKQDKMSASEWLKHVRTRFRLGLNKPQIGKAVDELRDYNRDFGLITEQITRALREALNEHRDDVATGRKSARSLNMLQRYHRVRYASRALYSTLQVQWMCSSHRTHAFDVRILDCDSGKAKGKALDARYITCELSITHDGSFYASKEPLRLEIEQACESDEEEAATAVQAAQDSAAVDWLASILEANAAGLKPVTAKSKVRHLFRSFRKDKQQQPQPAASAPQPPRVTKSPADFRTITAGAVSDLSLVDDFCTRFHEATTDCMGRSLLGSWRGPQAQWFCLPPAPPPALGTSQSLSDIVRWIAEEPILRSLPRALLVELAGNVAEGIMQFYSTPWLVPANLSHNVRYFNPAQSSAAAVRLRGPYFMTRLESTRTKAASHGAPTGKSPAGEATLTRRDIEAADFTEARNKLLFNFGILLLEIGYGRPWHELKQSLAKATAAVGEMPSDYRVAEKLAQLLVNQMGLTYPKIIKKCIGCDFGLGETDLDNEDLQRRFLEDVVLGLHQLREKMSEMDSTSL